MSYLLKPAVSSLTFTAGQVVEEADVMSLFAKPQHPYTQGLIQSTPKVEAEVDILESIKGNVPTPSNKPTGCYFHPRCPFAMDICKSEMPELKMNEQSGNKVRCWLHNSGKEVDLYGENLTYSN